MAAIATGGAANGMPVATSIPLVGGAAAVSDRYEQPTAGKSLEEVYALLREVMSASGPSGVARVVMHTRERLATPYQPATRCC